MFNVGKYGGINVIKIQNFTHNTLNVIIFVILSFDPFWFLSFQVRLN